MQIDGRVNVHSDVFATIADAEHVAKGEAHEPLSGEGEFSAWRPTRQQEARVSDDKIHHDA